jgi:hypothetical protein
MSDDKKVWGFTFVVAHCLERMSKHTDPSIFAIQVDQYMATLSPSSHTFCGFSHTSGAE